MTREELEKAMADRRAKVAERRAAQELIDLAAINEIEDSSGEILTTLKTKGYKEGAAAILALRTPKPSEYKRFTDMVSMAKDANAKRKAVEMLADVVWLYPPGGSELRKATLEAFPGALISVGGEAPKLAEAKAEDEGKE